MCRVNRGETHCYTTSNNYVCERPQEFQSNTTNMSNEVITVPENSYNTFSANAIDSVINTIIPPFVSWFQDRLRDIGREHMADILMYSEEKFGKSFKEEPKVRRENGVNIIEVDYFYRLNL